MLDGYIICATPRTGSTLLCGLLAATRQAGDPDSFYGARFIDWWAAEWGLPGRETLSEPEFQRLYLDAAIRTGKAGTSLFAMRLMQENLGGLCSLLDKLFPGQVSDRARLETAFGKLAYVHLSRADKLAQAVSLIRARQTGLWHIAPDGTEVERLAPPAEPVYDFELIRTELEMLEADDEAWNVWFEQQAIEPVRVAYETLSADPGETLGRLCRKLGVTAPDRAEIRPGVARLADETNNQWMHRYRQDAARPEPG